MPSALSFINYNPAAPEILLLPNTNPLLLISFVISQWEHCGSPAASPNTSESTLDSIDGQASPEKMLARIAQDSLWLRFRSIVAPSRD